MPAFRAASATALSVCVLALGLGACAASGGAATDTTAGGAPGRQPNEAHINRLRCTSAQLAQREAPIVYRPSWLGTRKAPLVIALHGAFGNGRLMAQLTGLEAVASRSGFVVVFPSACDLSRPWGSGQDLYYLDSLIHSQVATDDVDPSRVYIAGFSAGGGEAWRMACMFSKDVAAIAVVSDPLGTGIERACVLSRPLSQLLMVGTADGERWTGGAGFASAVRGTAWWRRVDHCTTAMRQSRPVSGVIQKTWSSCASGSAVALYEVLGAGHVWPPAGSGAPKNYNASLAVWNFLSGHSAAPTSLSSSDAALLGVRVTRSHGEREIDASFRLEEPVSVSETLDPPHQPPLRYRGHCRQGASVRLRFLLPSTVRGGGYTLKLALKDSYRRSTTIFAAVTVPSSA